MHDRSLRALVIAVLAVPLVLPAGGARAADSVFACPASDAVTTHSRVTADTPATTDSAVLRAPAVAPLFTRPEETVPPGKRTVRGLYLTAQDAYDMVREDPSKVLFIDIRTHGELQFIGVPGLIDANVPFVVQATPAKWDASTSSLELVANPEFVQRIGYANVYSVIDGFEGDPLPDGAQRGQRLVNGWRNAGLPWSTRLERDRIDGLQSPVR